MRFEHGSLRIECLAALILQFLLLLLLCRRTADAARSLSWTSQQCLLLDEKVPPEEACGPQGQHMHLQFCENYVVDRLLTCNKTDTEMTKSKLKELCELDKSASEQDYQFRQLLDRYDCVNNYSVSWDCEECQKAYKQWVCAMYLPRVKVEGEFLKPCRYICRLVEQKCPYFHPSVKDQYAGERVFKCIDPDIPDLTSFEDASSYGKSTRCYCPQHLDPKEDYGEAECRYQTQAQYNKTMSKKSGCAPRRPVLILWTLMATLMAAWWTMTR